MRVVRLFPGGMSPIANTREVKVLPIFWHHFGLFYRSGRPHSTDFNADKIIA